MKNQENENRGEYIFNFFRFNKKEISPIVKEENWDGIEHSLSKSLSTSHKKRNAALWVSGFMMAASLLLFFVSRNSNNKLDDTDIYQTDFAQIKKVSLPDGSLVTLNANSSLKVPKHWSEKGSREIWLVGEAYFEVTKKLATGQKFVVHTTMADVEVLGTKFNVNTRREESYVVLEEGKVRLIMKESASTKENSKKSKPVIVEMKPGEVASIESAAGVVIEPAVTKEHHYSGWVNNEFHFDHTSLLEISKTIEDTYGYKVVVDDPQLLKNEISGDLRAQSLSELVEVLKVAFNLDITIELNKTITVTNTAD